MPGTLNLRASVALYERVLGLERESVSEDWGWASMRRDGVHILLAGLNAHMAETKPAGDHPLDKCRDDNCA